MIADIKTLTRQIQQLVRTTADGIWGPKTAQAVLDELWSVNTPEKGETPLPEAPEAVEKEIPENAVWELDVNDKIDSRVHEKCVKVLNAFETGSITGNYADVSIYKDGGGGAYKQLTYGKNGATQDGNLDKLLNAYIAACGDNLTEAGKTIKANLPTKGKQALVTNTSFISALKAAGKEPIMQTTQNAFFDEAYFVPAYKWFMSNRFTLPLSMLVIYDSFIHSGGILSFLRNKFTEVPPAKGGDEKKWITAYVTARYNWLANHSNTILRNTVYRMNTMKALIAANDWDIAGVINANGVKIS